MNCAPSTLWQPAAARSMLLRDSRSWPIQPAGHGGMRLATAASPARTSGRASRCSFPHRRKKARGFESKSVTRRSTKPGPRQERLNPVGTRGLPAGLTPLKVASIRPETYRNYADDYQRFVSFAEKTGLLLRTVPQVDKVVAEYLTYLYTSGEGLAKAQRVMAAVLFMNPIVGRGARNKLPQAAQALRGYRRLIPPRARQPFPMAVIAMLAHALMEEGHADAALGILQSFELYLRPGQLFGVRAVDFVVGAPRRPLKGKSGERRSYADVVLNPQEVGVPSKTMEYDNCVSLDLARHAPLVGAVTRRLEVRLGRGWYARETESARRGGAMAKLMPKDSRWLLARVQASARRLQVNIGEIHLHRLRHSCASHDYAGRIRSTEDIRRRGRWKAVNSVRRYAKGATVQQLLASLPKEVQSHAIACEASLADLLSGSCRPRSVHWLPTSSSSSSDAVQASRKSCGARASRV